MLKGPVIVLGASGFIGANLFDKLAEEDVCGTASESDAWRLTDYGRILYGDLINTLEDVLDKVKPKTIFNCLSYGGYSWQKETTRIYRTNFDLTRRVLEWMDRSVVYVHAGSSSEYGENCTHPKEWAQLLPNSDYAVSKAASSHLIGYYGRKGYHCANLRLYSVYGPMEDSARLIPQIVINGCKGKLPPFTDPDISRDFVYIDDVCEAFIKASIEGLEGQSFNIGTGVKTTIRDVSETAMRLFDIPEVEFTMQKREWDRKSWYANPEKATEIGWTYKTPFSEGLMRTLRWYEALEDKEAYVNSSKRNQ